MASVVASVVVFNAFNVFNTLNVVSLAMLSNWSADDYYVKRLSKIMQRWDLQQQRVHYFNLFTVHVTRMTINEIYFKKFITCNTDNVT